MECLICKRTGQKLFNINLCCGDGQNTIKDDIIEFVGDSIADRLDDTQHVCNICMNMLDDIVKSKFKVLEAILTQNEQKYIPNLGRFWTFIAKSYQSKFEQDAFGDTITPSLTPNTPIPTSRDVTPLVFVSRTKAYNEKVERNVEIREGIKSEVKRFYRNASSRSSNITDYKRSRKEKSKIRSKSADIKKMGRQLVKSSQSKRAGRPISVTSEMSFLSFTEEDKKDEKEDDQYKGPVLVYDGDEIIYPVKRTRSVSRSHERNMLIKKLNDAKGEAEKLFHCPYPHCTSIKFGSSLAFFTSHMVEIHSFTPYYKCWACGNEFVTNDHLRLHLTNHDIYPVFCGMCGVKQPNVSTYQSHIDLHLTASFKCFCCDKVFITNKDCNNHIFSNHGRRKSYERREYRIVKQIDYKKSDSEEQLDVTCTTEKQYSFSVINVISNSKPVVFRGRSYPELDYLHRKRIAQPEVDIYTSGDPIHTSFGDDLNFNTNLVEGFTLSRKTPATPSGMFRDGITLYDFNTFSPSRRKRRKLTRDSGRSTPFERSNIPSDDEALDLDVQCFDNDAWLSSRRELESRNTELADIFAGESEADVESVREEGGDRDSIYNSDVEEGRNAEADSDVETETQYLDRNNFVSSINYDLDSNSEKC